jgi:hypothetical protein
MAYDPVPGPICIDLDRMKDWWNKYENEIKKMTSSPRFATDRAHYFYLDKMYPKKRREWVPDNFMVCILNLLRVLNLREILIEIIEMHRSNIISKHWHFFRNVQSPFLPDLKKQCSLLQKREIALTKRKELLQQQKEVKEAILQKKKEQRQQMQLERKKAKEEEQEQELRREKISRKMHEKNQKLLHKKLNIDQKVKHEENIRKEQEEHCIFMRKTLLLNKVLQFPNMRTEDSTSIQIQVNTPSRRIKSIKLLGRDWHVQETQRQQQLSKTKNGNSKSRHTCINTLLNNALYEKKMTQKLKNRIQYLLSIRFDTKVDN